MDKIVFVVQNKEMGEMVVRVSNEIMTHAMTVGVRAEYVIEPLLDADMVLVKTCNLGVLEVDSTELAAGRLTIKDDSLTAGAVEELSLHQYGLAPYAYLTEQMDLLTKQERDRQVRRRREQEKLRIRYYKHK